MISKLTRRQLIAVVLLTIVTMTLVSVQYVKLPRLLGIGEYNVSLDLPTSGDLYSNAIVTLNGVQVGVVRSVGLTRDGVVADLSIDNGTRIPADSLVSVRNTSAIGEQYVDFTPNGSTNRALQPGDTVPVAKVRLPIQISDVLANANTLVSSVPQAQLQTTIDELSNAFTNTGPSLQQLLDAAGLLLHDASDNLGPTTSLISTLRPVLATQQANSHNLATFTTNLASFTQQLRMSDADIRGAIDQGPGFFTSLNGLLSDVRPTLPTLLTNLTDVGQVVNVYLPNVAQTFAVLPAAVNALQAVSVGSDTPGAAKLYLSTAVHDPPLCTAGYYNAQRDPADTALMPVATGSYCKAPQDSRLDVRGLRNSPCPNNPAVRSPTAAGCGLRFRGPDPTQQKYVSFDGNQNVTPPQNPTYSPISGLFFGPDGSAYSLSPQTRQGTVPKSWQALLTAPLGGQ